MRAGDSLTGRQGDEDGSEGRGAAQEHPAQQSLPQMAVPGLVLRPQFLTPPGGPLPRRPAEGQVPFGEPPCHLIPLAFRQPVEAGGELRRRRTGLGAGRVDEVAVALGCGLRAATMRLHRARRRLGAEIDRLRPALADANASKDHGHD